MLSQQEDIWIEKKRSKWIERSRKEQKVNIGKCEQFYFVIDAPMIKEKEKGV